jgi:class 3 adenylate cyclase
MALSMREAVAKLATGWKKRGYGLGFGVGIAGGYATIGAIGYEGRLEYSAIGTVVNLAARLCGEASDSQILISSRILSKIEAAIDVEPLGELSLKGFSRPVPAYNVLGVRERPVSGQP